MPHVPGNETRNPSQVGRTDFEVPGLNLDLGRLEEVGRGFGQTVQGLVPFLSLIPGFSNFFQSPAGQTILRQAEGARLSQGIRDRRPELQGPPLTESMFPLEDPRGGTFDVSLPAIGEQALRERQQAFQELQNLRQAQERETGSLRDRLDISFRSLADAEGRLRNLGLSVTDSFRKNFVRLNQFRREARGMLNAGLQVTTQMLEGIRAGNQQVMENLDADIRARASAMSEGIRSSADQQFESHMRALDSVSPLSAEERANLKAFYNRQAARDMALGMGSLHEAAAEFRATTEAGLQQSLANATSFAISTTGRLIGDTQQALTAAEQIGSSLTQAHAIARTNIEIARAELAEFTGQLALDGGQTLFSMVTQTARPVAIFSDILQGVFDQGWDIMAFHNQLEQQELANFLVEQNPMHQAIFAGLDIFAQGAAAGRQADIAESQNDAALAGAGIQAAGTILGGPIGGLIAGAGTQAFQRQQQPTGGGSPGPG